MPRSETEAARAAELERCALPPLEPQGGFDSWVRFCGVLFM